MRGIAGKITAEQKTSKLQGSDRNYPKCNTEKKEN